MATITPTVVPLSSNAVKVLWETVTHADSGGSTDLDESPLRGDLSAFPGKTVSAAGTFAGGLSLALEGSNDGTNWFACHSLGGSVAAGNAIAFTAAGSAVVAQNARFYRVTRTSGSASDVDVVMACAT